LLCRGLCRGGINKGRHRNRCYKCDFSQSQFNFLFDSYLASFRIFALAHCIARYIVVVSKIILTLHCIKYNRIHFLVYIILERALLRALKRFVFIGYPRDDRHGIALANFGSSFLYISIAKASIAGYPRGESHDSLIPKLAIKSRVAA